MPESSVRSTNRIAARAGLRNAIHSAAASPRRRLLLPGDLLILSHGRSGVLALAFFLLNAAVDLELLPGPVTVAAPGEDATQCIVPLRMHRRFPRHLHQVVERSRLVAHVRLDLGESEPGVGLLR